MVAGRSAESGRLHLTQKSGFAAPSRNIQLYMSAGGSVSVDGLDQLLEQMHQGVRKVIRQHLRCYWDGVEYGVRCDEHVVVGAAVATATPEDDIWSKTERKVK